MSDLHIDMQCKQSVLGRISLHTFRRIVTLSIISIAKVRDFQAMLRTSDDDQLNLACK